MKGRVQNDYVTTPKPLWICDPTLNPSGYVTTRRTLPLFPGLAPAGGLRVRHPQSPHPDPEPHPQTPSLTPQNLSLHPLALSLHTKSLTYS